ncbi:Proline iminopeptidase [Linum perenne]
MMGLFASANSSAILLPAAVASSSSTSRCSSLPSFSLHISSSFLSPHFSIGRKKIVARVRNLNHNFEQELLGEVMESGKNDPQDLNRSLYPALEPYDTGFLKVSDVHSIYYEQSGNPTGHPVIFLHGGPGGGTAPSNRRFFDPEFYRIVLFDQRGAGKSVPHACLEHNTTWELIDDIEKLREYLKITEWQVFGGSWGSTLSLAYSQSHPDKVTGLVLRGIFLLRKKEIDWFYEGGAAAIFPDGMLYATLMTLSIANCCISITTHDLKLLPVFLIMAD